MKISEILIRSFSFKITLLYPNMVYLSTNRIASADIGLPYIPNLQINKFRPKLMYFSVENLIDVIMVMYYDVRMLSTTMNRTHIVIAKKEELDDQDAEYWSRATIAEKLQTITFLRECFYGEEATTGRLQRVYTMLKLK